MPHRKPIADRDAAAAEAARRAQLLDRRAAQLAGRIGVQGAADAMPGLSAERRMAVRCGDAWYGFALDDVQEVLPMAPVTPLPAALPGTLGLFGHRGRLANLLDMAVLLGLPAERAGNGNGRGKPAGHILVLRPLSPAEAGSAVPPVLALAVDRVAGAVPAAAVPTEAQAAGAADVAMRYAAVPPGHLGAAETLMALVDLPRLLQPVLSRLSPLAANPGAPL